MSEDTRNCRLCGAPLEGRDIYEGVCATCREEEVLGSANAPKEEEPRPRKREPSAGSQGSRLPGEAIAIEAHNPSEEPVIFRMALVTFGKDSDSGGVINEWMDPNSSQVFFFEHVDEPIKALSIAFPNQPEPVMRLYVSPVCLIRK